METIRKETSSVFFPGRLEGQQLRVLWLVACLVASIAGGLPAKGTQDNWRTIAREARKALARSRFEQAADGYRDAIAALKGTSPRAEAIYDLRLCLADTLRQAGKFEAASAVLDEVESSVIGKRLFDPMLTARYWRKRALLQAATSKTREAGSSVLKSLDVMLKCFPPQSPHMLGTLPKLMEQLASIESWEAVQQLIQQTRVVYGSAPAVENQLLDSYRRILSRYAHLADTYSRSGQLAKSQEILVMLSTLSPESASLLDRWQHWIDRRSLISDGEKPDRAKASILQILNSFQRVGSSEGKLSELRARLLLMRICLLESAPAGELIHQTREIKNAQYPFRQRGALQGRLLAAQNEICRLLHQQIVKRFASSTFDDATNGLIEEEVRLTAYPEDYEAAPEAKAQLREFADHHFRARTMQTFFFLTKPDPEAAARAVKSMSPNAIRDCSFAMESLSRLNLRIGVCYANHGKLSLAQVYLERAEKFFNKAPDSIDRAKLKTDLHAALVDFKEKAAAKAPLNGLTVPEGGEERRR